MLMGVYIVRFIHAFDRHLDGVFTAPPALRQYRNVYIYGNHEARKKTTAKTGIPYNVPAPQPHLVSHPQHRHTTLKV